MVILKKALPRRTFLRGAGRGAGAAAARCDDSGAWPAAETARPIRLAFIEVPNGIMMDKWTPKTEGAVSSSRRCSSRWRRSTTACSC